MNPTYDFTGQVAFVTGASSGMGLTTAQAFADAGAAVVLADINRDALAAATDQLAAAGRHLGIELETSPARAFRRVAQSAPLFEGLTWETINQHAPLDLRRAESIRTALQPN